MKIRPKIRNPEALGDARRLVQAGAGIEIVLAFLRDRGFDLADCIYSVQDLFGTEFSEAKSAVIQSRAWSDRYESDTHLRRMAREALKKLAESNSADLPQIDFEDEND